MTTNRQVYVHALGCDITLSFAHPDAAVDAEELFRPLIHRPWRSPDFIIEYPAARLEREFIRTWKLAEPRDEGTRIYSVDHPDGLAWNSLDPPFPPVSLNPMKDRFIRLHGAAAVNPAGHGLLILGESGAGKTTVSGQLIADHGYTLLTDEDVFLWRRSTLVHPYLNAAPPWKHDGARLPYSDLNGRAATAPAMISRIVVLSPAIPPDVLEPLSPRQVLRVLMESQRPGGSAPIEGVLTMTGLARAAPSVAVHGGDYKALLAAVPLVAAYGAGK